jgi:hypothetical protein
MFRYHICRIDIDRGQYTLNPIAWVFDKREEAEAFMKDANNHGHGGVWLTILEVYEP